MLELFVEMCSLVQFDGEEFYFSNEFEYMTEYVHITKNENYPILLEKMNKLMILMNEDHTLYHKDIETELWQML